MLFIHQRLSKSAIVRTCLCGGPNDENTVVVSFAVKTAKTFWEMRVKEKGFRGEGLGSWGMHGEVGFGGGGGVVSLMRKRNNKLKSKREKLK